MPVEPAVLQLSQVMHQQNGDVEAVGNALDGGNVIVVVAVHSRFPSAASGILHLLECVDDHHLCFREVLQEVNDFFLQPVPDQAAGHG